MKKRKIWTIVGVLFVIGMIGNALGLGDKKEENTENNKSVSSIVSVVSNDKSASSIASHVTNNEKEEVNLKSSAANDMKSSKTSSADNKNKSDKVSSETKNSSSAKESELDKISIHVREAKNDVTGNWRIVTIAEPIQVKDIALDYYKKYFKNDNEVHVIVNFQYNTTTTISNIANLLDVYVYEHVEKEEHDAKLMGRGMLLEHYYVYKDTGEIEDIKSDTTE